MSDLKEKVLIIISHADFRDEEYEKPRKVLETQGVSVTVASSDLSEAQGMLGAVVKPDVLITQVKMVDFDGVIFVGGRGASEYWNDPAAHSLARDAYSSGKVVAAICIAPVTLANAGILKGKKATVFSAQREMLQTQGAINTDKTVEIDGNIITGKGPEAAQEFGEAVAAALFI